MASLKPSLTVTFPGPKSTRLSVADAEVLQSEALAGEMTLISELAVTVVPWPAAKVTAATAGHAEDAAASRVRAAAVDVDAELQLAALIKRLPEAMVTTPVKVLAPLPLSVRAPEPLRVRPPLPPPKTPAIVVLPPPFTVSVPELLTTIAQRECAGAQVRESSRGLPMSSRR